MAEKKIHDVCGREVAHTASGAPYRHNCRPRPVMVRCGTCDTDVPAREDGSVSFHHVPGTVTDVCAGSDTVGPVGPPLRELIRTDALAVGDWVLDPMERTPFKVVGFNATVSAGLRFHNRATDENEPGIRVLGVDPSGEEVAVDVAPSYRWTPAPWTERCVACGRDVELENGEMPEHLRPQSETVGVPPKCEGSPGGPSESTGPAPFGGDPATEVGGTRNRPSAGLVVGPGNHLTEDQRALVENGPTHPLAELVVHPGPVVSGARHLVFTPGATDADTAMAFLGGPSRPSIADHMAAGNYDDAAAAAMAVLEAEEVVPLNVSGQPRERTNRTGYLITDPATGDFRRFGNGNIKGFTRCTTLVKAISDNAALHDWNKRNVLIGAVKRPDVVARAYGMTHEGDREALNDIVEALEDIAGAKIAAQAGTDVHEVSELLDGGRLSLMDVPPYWRALMAEYRRKLGEHGLEPVPGLIERTTYTSQYGGVAGTFDRVLFHRPSRTYVMSDVKTGQGALTYGRLEIPAQLAVYVEGANEHGVYDWNTDTWHPLEYPVRRDWGLVIHMPLQGREAHTVELYPAPLGYGREVAEKCAEVRTGRSLAPKFAAMTRGFLMVRDWEMEFSSVRTPAEASRLYREARASGDVSALRLGELVAIAQRVVPTER